MADLLGSTPSMMRTNRWAGWRHVPTGSRMNAGGPDDAALFRLACRGPSGTNGECDRVPAACWGPVNFRHRTVRPEWFCGFDDAWRCRIESRSRQPKWTL